MKQVVADAILEGPAGDRVSRLVAAVEDQWFDRKSIRIAPETLARSLVGFANAEGGTIVVGLSDGRVEDVAADERRVNALRQAALRFTAPRVRVRFSEIEVVDDGEVASLLVAKILPGEAMHEMTNGDVFLRVGDSTVKLDRVQREELAYDRGSSQFEARPVPSTSDEVLDAHAVGEYCHMLGLAEPEHALRARSLLTPDGSPTIAATLLFGRRPAELFPHAHVRVLRYTGSDRGAGAHQALQAGRDLRFDGTVPEVLRDAAERIDEWMPRRQALRADGRFGPAPVVPRDVWLEGLVNAVVHRSYSMSGDHIRVEIFDDRLEIESPGRFPGLVDPSLSLDVSRYARNPRIARVCGDLGLTQELGEGIRRMVREMREHGLTDPLYRQTSGSVRLTLSGNPRLTPAVAAQLPPGSDLVLQQLRHLGRPVGTGEVVGATGFGRPKVIRVLEALRDAGLAQWHGKSRRDPRATWTIVP